MGPVRAKLSAHLKSMALNDRHEEEQTNLHIDLSRTICDCNHCVIYLSRGILRCSKCFAPTPVKVD